MRIAPILGMLPLVLGLLVCLAAPTVWRKVTPAAGGAVLVVGVLLLAQGGFRLGGSVMKVLVVGLVLVVGARMLVDRFRR